MPTEFGGLGFRVEGLGGVGNVQFTLTLEGGRAQECRGLGFGGLGHRMQDGV